MKRIILIVAIAATTISCAALAVSAASTNRRTVQHRNEPGQHQPMG